MILEKPEGGGGGGGGDILDCQQNSAAQPLVLFVGGIKNVCVRKANNVIIKKCKEHNDKKCNNSEAM